MHTRISVRTRMSWVVMPSGCTSFSTMSERGDTEALALPCSKMVVEPELVYARDAASTCVCVCVCVRVCVYLYI